MDKKTEIAMAKRREAALHEPSTPTKLKSAATATLPPPPTGWWMYHGDPEHTGFVSDSSLSTTNVSASSFQALFTLQLGGPVLSVPAISDGFVYVGLANFHAAEGGNGGALLKIDIQTGKTVKTFSWNLENDNEDAHSFTGMGCTPMIFNGRVYFGAFNGKFYCLNQDTLELEWVTDLRNEDLKHNQPITNNNGVGAGYPAAV